MQAVVGLSKLQAADSDGEGDDDEEDSEDDDDTPAERADKEEGKRKVRDVLTEILRFDSAALVLPSLDQAFVSLPPRLTMATESLLTVFDSVQQRSSTSIPFQPPPNAANSPDSPFPHTRHRSNKPTSNLRTRSRRSPGQRTFDRTAGECRATWIGGTG